MNVHYTRKNELTPDQQKKSDTKLAKIAKLLDGPGGEKEAHVILNSERHLHNAEITVNYYDHTMVGAASDPDMFTAVCSAVDKLEKQVLKHRAKWREKRAPRNGISKESTLAAAEPSGEPEPAPSAAGRVFRVSGGLNNKPMTVDEALLSIDKDRDYLVYRDAESDRLSILLRRRDGNFDLIEG